MLNPTSRNDHRAPHRGERALSSGVLVCYSALGGVVSVNAGLAVGRLAEGATALVNVVTVLAIALPTAMFGILGHCVEVYWRQNRRPRGDLRR